MKKKWFIYVMIAMLLVSFGWNLYLFRENNRFKESEGSKYQSAVNKTIFNVQPQLPDEWAKELIDNDDVKLQEREIDKIYELSHLFGSSSMNPQMQDMMVDELNHVVELMRMMQKEYDNGLDMKATMAELQIHVDFIQEELEGLKGSLDEDGVYWYKELTGDSDMIEKMWGEYNEFRDSH
ncbi:hypothetical protein [Falsibacillus albus]|uniref:Uncharacterized protein n=1 Tax=Falsibacillus albus TaxID=2478915 RepID=A0A3L7JUZ8_9BACI|nr:hypothetical protein [Falsibacillus albus]RLQ94350.1 hypothetical protein D9X91_14965 [Falsibacillus albus]